MNAAFQLMKFILNAKPDQIEGLIRTHQRNRNLTEDGFESYMVYRQKILDEIKKSLTPSTEESKKTGED